MDADTAMTPTTDRADALPWPGVEERARISIRAPHWSDCFDYRDVWRYRHLLRTLMRREIKSRFRQTLLGPLWLVVTPLARMVIFTLVFGKLARLPSDGIPYPIFTYTALLPWELFASSVNRSTSSLLKYVSIIPKVYFPRLLVPIAEALTGLVEFACSFAILILLVLLYGVPLTWRLLSIPFIVILAMASGLAVGLFFAALQVRYRDVSNMVGFLIQAWAYATPVAYAASVAAERLPENLWFLYRLNPMYGVVESFRWAVLGTREPSAWLLLGVVALVMAALALGAAVFQRAEHSIVDLM